MIFSKRLDWARRATEWCDENNISPMPANIVTALNALGLFKGTDVEDKLDRVLQNGTVLTVQSRGELGGFDAHLQMRNDSYQEKRWYSGGTITDAIETVIEKNRDLWP